MTTALRVHCAFFLRTLSALGSWGPASVNPPTSLTALCSLFSNPSCSPCEAHLWPFGAPQNSPLGSLLGKHPFPKWSHPLHGSSHHHLFADNCHGATSELSQPLSQAPACLSSCPQDALSSCMSSPSNSACPGLPYIHFSRAVAWLTSWFTHFCSSSMQLLQEAVSESFQQT